MDGQRSQWVFTEKMGNTTGLNCQEGKVKRGGGESLRVQSHPFVKQNTSDSNEPQLQ